MKKLVMRVVVALTRTAMAAAGSGQATTSEPEETKGRNSNLGVYFDYTRLQSASLNMFGVGGRVGFGLPLHLTVEADLAYDFKRTSSVTVSAGGVSSTVSNDVRMLHALFG